jgi:hypothetical protein
VTFGEAMTACAMFVVTFLVIFGALCLWSWIAEGCLEPHKVARWLGVSPTVYVPDPMSRYGEAMQFAIDMTAVMQGMNPFPPIRLGTHRPRTHREILAAYRTKIAGRFRRAWLELRGAND